MKNIYFWMLTLLCSTLMFSGTNNFTFDSQTEGWSMFQTRAFGPDTAFKYDGNFNHVFYANTSATLAEFGDTCDAPIVVTALPFSASGNTADYGDNYSSSDVPAVAPGAITNGTGTSSYLNGDDVVIAYTPSVDQLIDITTTNDDDWIGLWAFTGCPFSSTVGYHVATGGTTRAINELPVTAGTTYYFVISSWPSPQSTDFTISIKESGSFDCPNLQANIGGACDDGDATTVNDTVNADCECVGTPIASNDDACTATALACGDEITQTLIGATESLDDSCYGTGTSDVWFTFTTDGSQIVTVAETSALDAVVQLFVGDDCDNMVEAGACKDSPENFTVTEAGTYFFRVRPYYVAGNEGTIVVSLTCVDYDCPALQANIGDSCDDGNPNTANDIINENCECEGTAIATNDECEDAISLTVNSDLNCEITTQGTTVGATASPQPDDVTGTPNNDVWFTFVATASSHNFSLSNVVAVVGTSVDMGMGIYDLTASSCELPLLVGD